MAVLTTDTVIPRGSRKNMKQGIIMIPAEAAANKPGLLCLQDVDDNGVVGEHYVWFDHSGVMRYGTSIPTNQDGEGTTLGSSAGATAALDNIASCQINTSLLSDTANTDDLGTDAAPWRSAYLGTSLVFDQTTRNLTIAADEPGTAARTVTFGDPTADDNVAYLNTSQAFTTKTYNGLTVVAGSNAISLTQGSATIAVAAAGDLNVGAGGDVDFGTGDIQFNGSAAYDQATGTAVDINANLTVSGAATIDQDLSASGAPTWTSLVTCQGIVNTTTAIDTTAAINIGADSTKLTFGVADASDSYIEFDGSTLLFYDTTTGPWTLAELATGTTLNPTVTGNLVIGDGNFTWTNASAAESAVWTLAATTVDGIQINSSNTTADVIQVTADACANGTLLLLDADGGPGSSGFYVRCHDGSATDFSVGADGAVVGTGPITLAYTGDVASKISRNNATGTSPILEIEETNAAGGVALLIDSNHTGAADAMQITYDGTDSGLNITGTAVTGSALTVTGPAAQTAALIDVVGTAVAGWDGAAGVGMVNIAADGAHADAAASLLNITDGTGACIAAARGSCLRIADTTTVGADSFVAYISTTANDGLKIDTGHADGINLELQGVTSQVGPMLYMDGTTTNGWDGAASTGMLHIVGKGAHVNAAASLAYITEATGASIASGRGTCLGIVDATTVGADSWVGYIKTTANDGLLIENGHVDGIALWLKNSTAGVDKSLHVDGTTGTWVGASNKGLAHIDGDGVLVAGANLLRVYHATGAPTAQSHLVEIEGAGTWAGSTDGMGLRITGTGAAAGTSSELYVASTGNNAAHLVTTAVAATGLIVDGPAAQTAPMVHIDGATGTWIGAPTVGMLDIESDGAVVADGSLLRIDNQTQPAAANDGVCLEIIETGAAQATSYAVRIASTSNEALHVDTGAVLVDETLTATLGVITETSHANVNDATPTAAELTGAFGATSPDGWIGIVDDNNAGAISFLVWSEGASYFFVKGTKAT